MNIMVLPRRSSSSPYHKLVFLLCTLHATICAVRLSHGFQYQYPSAISASPRATKKKALEQRPCTSSRRSCSIGRSRIGSSSLRSTTTSSSDESSDSNTRLYFDVGIIAPDETIPLGRLSFHLTPPTHPHYLPLHSTNLQSLASSTRRAVDPKATYEGCVFQYSPATIEDGSFRYRWGHVCEGFGRNGIRTNSVESGDVLGYDEPFSDPQRVKECVQNCFGGVYYGQRYEEIVDILNNENAENSPGQGSAAILLTVPIQGPGSGTSKFSIVRVSESPREWGERLLENSAVVGYLDCGANGSFGDEDSEEEGPIPTSLDVLQAMARQRVGPPKIMGCGVISVD